MADTLKHMASDKPRVLSGIQTSGLLHLGNYLGALKQFAELQHDYDCYFFLADLHALTVPQDPKKFREQIRHAANVHFACGIDPKRSVFFRQSDISAHAELGWLLNTIATMGELKRMTQFKDKTSRAKEDSIGVGLFDYPVLQAADILLYQTDLVPVGEDQKQHIELTRDLAERFNHRFGQVFTVPKPLIPKVGARIMGLDDPKQKMSKSASSELNYIALTDSSDEVARKLNKAVTDSGNQIKGGSDKPALTNLLTIYSLLTDEPIGKLESRFSGKTYREFKAELTDAVVACLKPIQKTLAELEGNPDYTDSVLTEGADRARPVAEKTLSKAKQALGL